MRIKLTNYGLWTILLLRATKVRSSECEFFHCETRDFLVRVVKLTTLTKKSQDLYNTCNLNTWLGFEIPHTLEVRCFSFENPCSKLNRSQRQIYYEINEVEISGPLIPEGVPGVIFTPHCWKCLGYNIDALRWQWFKDRMWSLKFLNGVFKVNWL